MADQLKGKRVAALATHGFEQEELLQPRKALIDAGAAVDVVSPDSQPWSPCLAVARQPGRRSCGRDRR